MGNSVDKRVVELEFNNAKFESGVAESLRSLEKFDAALDSGSLKSNPFDNLEKSLSRISESSFANRVAGPLVSGLETVGGVVDGVISKVSSLKTVLGTVGAVVAGLAAGGVIGAAISGGKRRAQNIEMANFMLEGMFPEEVGKEGGKIAKIGEQVSQSVLGTAYGYDVAAKAAAQLAASGVDVGEAWDDSAKIGGELATALRGIAGVAAMTGSEYEDIASIFTTVAGNGRVMATELNRIGMRGLNARAALAEYLGVAESDISEMTRKGEIDFQTFSNAMTMAFGDQAKRANETFSGALSNIKASLSRMGEKFATPAYNLGKRIFQGLLGDDEVKGPLKQFEEVLVPFSDAWSSALGVIGDGTVTFLNKLARSGAITNLAQFFKGLGHGISDFAGTGLSGLEFVASHFEELGSIFGNIWSTISAPLMAIGDGISRALGGEDGLFSARNIENAFKAIESATETLRPSETVLSAISSVSEVLATALLKIVDVAGDLAGVFGPVLAPALDIVGSVVGTVSDKFLKFVDVIKKATGGINPFEPLLLGVRNTLRDFFHLFDGGLPSFDELLNFFATTKKVLGGFGSQFSTNMGLVIGRLSEFAGLDVGKFVGGISDFFNELSNKVDLFSIFDTVSGGIGGAISAISEFLSTFDLLGGVDTDKIASNAQTLAGAATNMADAVKTAAGGVSGVGEKFESVFDKFSTLGTTFRLNLETIGEAISGFFAGLTKNDVVTFGSVLSSLGLIVGVITIFRDVRSTLKTLTGMATSLQGLVVSLQGVLDNVAGLLSSVGNALNTFGKGFNKFGIAAVILSVAVAIGALALSLYGLSKIDDRSLAKAVLTLAGVMIALVGLVFLISKIAEKGKGQVALEKVSASLLGFAAAILILAVAAAAFSMVPTEGMAKAAGALVALVGAAALLSLMSNKLGSFVKIAAGLNLLSVSLLGIAAACIVFALVPVSGMEKVAAAAAALVAVAFVLSMISHAFGSFVKVAIGLNLVVTALLGLAAACIVFTLIPTRGILKAAAALLILSGAAVILGKAGSDASFVRIGLSLMGMGVALIAVGAACKIFEGVDWGTIAMAGVVLGALVASLSVLSWFEAANGNIDTSAKSMITMSAALLIVAAAIKVMASIPFPALVAGILSFVVVLGLLGVAVGLLTAFPVAQEALVLLAGALHTIAMAMLIGAAAVAAFTLALVLFGALGPAAMMGAVAAFDVFLQGIIDLAPKLLIAITLLIEVAALAMANGAVVLAEALALVLLALLQKLLEYGPIFADTIVAILLTIVFKIMEYSGVFAAAAIDLIVEFAMGLATAIRVETPRILGSFEALFNSIMYLLTSLFADMVDGIWPGNPFAESLREQADAFKAESEAQEQRFKDAGASMTERWLEGVKEKSPDASQILGDQLSGMLGQLEGSMPEFNLAGSDLGGTTLDGLLSSYGGLSSSVGMIDDQTLEQMGIDRAQFEEMMSGAGADSSAAFSDSFSTLPDDTEAISSSATQSIIEQFQNHASDLSSAAESTASKVPEATETGMAGTDKKVDTVLNRAKNTITAKSGEMRSAASSTFSNVPAGAEAGSSGVVSRVRANVSGVPSMVRSYGDSAYSSGYSVGDNIGAGMENGIASRISAVAAASALMVRRANAAAKAESKEGSPSRVMYQKGVWYAQGFINGIKSLYYNVSKTSSGMVRGAIDSTVQGFGELAGALDGIDYNPVIRPVFDGSQLESGIHRANRLMVQNQMVSAGYAGRQAPVLSAQAASGYTNNISISLNYDAGADANQIVRDLGMALRSRNIMEG